MRQPRKYWNCLLFDKMKLSEDKNKIIDKLASDWLESGLEKGDMVLIHSALSGFLKRFKEKNVLLTPQDILESFIRAVGENGTLIFPTFNFEFTKGKTFDIRNTVSETGALTEAARLHPESVRTGHPLFSFAVLGKEIDKFRGLYNFSAFGKDSPFGILHERNGKIAVLDLGGEKCSTFYHYVEESENAPNRYHKLFRGPYIDYDGKETIREFNLYARNLEMKVITDIKPMEDLIWSKNLYIGYPPGEGTCLHVIDAVTLYNEIADVIRKGNSLNMLYRIGN